jgi:hypothetical protein
MYVFDRENDYEKDEESFTIRYPSNLGQTKNPGSIIPEFGQGSVITGTRNPGFCDSLI